MNNPESQITTVKKLVDDILSQDSTGHGVEHINRVHNLSLQFAQQEQADSALVSLIALLHDVDDYKLFGKEAAGNLPNAKHIMQEAKISPDVQATVCSELRRLGYSKRLQGIHPETLEGKIVSDADMCDGLGAVGILRTIQYSTAHGRPFFCSDIFPRQHLNMENYVSNHERDTSINHIFEKILHLKDLMLTNSGKHEAKARHDFVVLFLRQFFYEENVPAWEKHLNDFLANQNQS